MAYGDVLVHTATPIFRRQGETVVEGERGVTETQGTPFRCCLFLPLGEEQANPRGGRKVTRPTLLMPTNGPALSPEDELLILAPELNGTMGVPAGEAVRWQVDGGQQPYGRPGSRIVGSQVNLVRVED